MKKSVLILLLLNSFMWAKYECDFSVKSISTESNPSNIIKVQSSCKYWEKENLAVVVTQFTNEDKSEYKPLAVVSIFDTKQNKRIISKNISTNKKLLLVENISLYPFHRFSITFTVSKKIDAYGGRRELFLYEFKEKKLHKLLSNFVVKDWEEEADFESFESIFTYVLKKESLKSKSYLPLVFSKKYQFNYSNEYDAKHPIHQEWKVNLDPVELLYDENKKEYKLTKKEKPLFDLAEVAKNTKKGWKYKEVVLRAMVYTVPISVKNIGSYQEIEKNLQDATHEKESKLLKKWIKDTGIVRKEDFTKGFNIWHYKKKDIVSLLKNFKGDFKPRNILSWKSKIILDVNEDTLIKAVCHVKNDDIEFLFFIYNQNRVKVYSYDFYEKNKIFLGSFFSKYDDIDFIIEDNNIYFSWGDEKFDNPKKKEYQEYYKYKYTFGTQEKFVEEKYLIEEKFSRDSPIRNYNHKRDKHYMAYINKLMIKKYGKNQILFELQEEEDNTFHFNEIISWSEDDKVIYLDNSRGDESGIWRYDTQSKELTEIVPKHIFEKKRQEPFAFTYKGKEYVLYIEYQHIKVATKAQDNWQKECLSYDADWFSKKLEQKYSAELKDYIKYNAENTLMHAYCSESNNENEAIIIKPYNSKNKISRFDDNLSLLIAIVDVKTKEIKQSHFHENAVDTDRLYYDFIVDRKSYWHLSKNTPFSIIVKAYVDGPPEELDVQLFIYERIDKTLKPILSGLTLEKENVEMGWESSNKTATIKKREMNFDYPPLVYKYEYDYYHEAEEFSKQNNWNVALDDIVCTYKTDNYECKVKSIFDLKEIARNLEKGLKYKELVLRAMLWDTEITKENVEDAQAIVDYFTKYKQHPKIAKILLERVNAILFQRGFKKIHTEVEDVKPLLFENKGIAKALCVVPWLQKKLVTFKEGEPLKVYAYKKDEKVEFLFFALVKNEVGDSFVNLYRINQKNHSYELIKEYKEKVTKSKEDWRGFDPYYFYYKNNTIYFKADRTDNRYRYDWEYVYSFNPLKEDSPKKVNKVFDFKKGYFYNHIGTTYINISGGELSLVWGNGKKDKQFIVKAFHNGFFVDEISWSEDDFVIYFDNHGMATACIWRYDIDTHELSKIVPEHEAEVPFAFTLVDKEYVVYIEGKDIKVATENTIMNPKIKDSCEDYASISSKEPKQCIKVKKKSWLYNKADVKRQSKKFLIKNDVALILKRKEGWYKIYFHHSKLNTKTTLWIKEEDVERLK